jgi:hypothetical protein
MLRWLYPKDRDYLFTLWDFFVSLTLLVVYVAGFRLLLLVYDWGHTFAAVYHNPQSIYCEVTRSQYVFRTKQPQQLHVVVYQLQDRVGGNATYQRVIVPLPPMTQGTLFYSTVLDYAVNPEHNELRFNDQSVSMVKLESLRTEQEFGKLSGQKMGGLFDDWLGCVLDSNQYRQFISDDRYVPFPDSYYVIHIMNDKALRDAPEQVSIPLPVAMLNP